MQKPAFMFASFTLMLALLMSVGCATNPVPKARSFDASTTDRNQGYALLYTLVGKNKDVDKILAIKSVTPSTKALILDIAKLCKDAHTQLELFAKSDPTLNLQVHGLPKYEEQTREAIEATTTKRLLFVSGDLFEVRLIQTQTQSTDYLAHLALMLAKNEKNQARATYLNELSKEAGKYYTQAMNRLALNHGGDNKDK